MLTAKEKKKIANRAWRLKNKEKCLISDRAYYQNNKEKIKARSKLRQDKLTSEERAEYSRRFYIKNKVKEDARTSKYSKENLDKGAASAAKRRAREHQADIFRDNPEIQKQIQEIYKQAKIKSAAENKKYEVDHIIPLKNKKVCGLHAPRNLQLLEKTENRKKYNSFNAEHFTS